MRRAPPAKLQKRDNRALYTREMFDKPYDNENSFGATYGEHREALEFGKTEYEELQAESAGSGWRSSRRRSTCKSADFLAELGAPAYKIASGDLKNTPLLKHVAKIGKPMIVSTGGGTLDDVQRAYDTVMPINPRLCLMQCTCGYPGGVRRARPARDRDLSREVPRRRDRILRSRQRHRDAARRLHARRARDREALHAEPRDEGHRPSLLARAGRHEEDDSRPAARARWRSATAQEGATPARRARC